MEDNEFQAIFKQEQKLNESEDYKVVALII